MDVDLHGFGLRCTSRLHLDLEAIEGQRSLREVERTRGKRIEITRLHGFTFDS